VGTFQNVKDCLNHDGASKPQGEITDDVLAPSNAATIGCSGCLRRVVRDAA
jgi:hypothetical protein